MGMAQSVLPMVSAANTVHPVDTWKCDSLSALSESYFEALTAELIYAFMEAGNPAPACVPVPSESAESLIESVWMRLGYWLKKYEQWSWASYYATEPAASLADYLAADSFYLWSSYTH